MAGVDKIISFIENLKFNEKEIDYFRRNGYSKEFINYLKRNTIDNFELVELQKPIFKNGELVYNDPEIFEKQKYCNNQMKTLYPEIKREEMPHEYYVDGTEEYISFKTKLIEDTKRLVNKK